jgi:hypothetical protein
MGYSSFGDTPFFDISFFFVVAYLLAVIIVVFFNVFSHVCSAFSTSLYGEGIV